ncbi:N-acetylglucosamine repressor [Frondihabitans sp. 762G35]|uniref:ROK family transcriptional regulator n=1 Tax=Frondihabitans sp. 762G35 TaxID=1446794 RepID=UPI000D2284B3|nr:ROK family transcriptional regulator [Frondihabitans sp. 762G35]ARC56261.1 N-acetylglucosamine repressor [Frondihabitans sp. 762G35]
MNPNHLQDSDYVAGSAGDVLRLIRSSDAMSRSTLARTTGLAPSTVSLRVEALVALGLVREQGTEDSRGGRRARRLALAGDAGFVAGVDVGANHVRVVLSDLAGRVLADSDTDATRAVGVSEDPAETVDALWAAINELAAVAGLDPDRFRGAAIGIPAPIEYPSGRVVTPSFRPTWHEADLPGLFARHTPAPVLVENDANLIALYESTERGRTDENQLLAIKIGTRIGCGILASGRLHRGIGGAAGEISHMAVAGESVIACTCGVPNCLDSVASGGAIAAKLRALGLDAAGASDVVALGARGEPLALDALREAGAMIGQSLAGIVNFFNPREVVLAGSMSASLPLVAAIRAELFQKCLPLVAHDLEVRATRDARVAGIRGATLLALDEVLAPARIDALLRETADDVRTA